MSKTLTVIGATGTQGSSVVEAALNSSQTWRIRAITRNPDSRTAQALRSKGVEVVKADLNELSSIANAFADSYAIFAVTDFFGPFAALGANSQKAMEIEWTQANNIIQAALACETLQHFVWSTLPHATRISNGKIKPAHFQAKNRGEDLIRAHPSLLAKTTFAYVGWYASNFQYPSFKPTWMETVGSHVQVAPAPADVPLHTIGDPRANIGNFVLAALANPDITLLGRSLHVAIEETNMGKLLRAWSEATGKKALYVQTTIDSYDTLWPGWGEVEGVMLQFYDVFRNVPWLPNGERMVMATDLGLEVNDMISTVKGLKMIEL